MNAPRIFYSIPEFQAAATELFGPDRLQWKFKCPECGVIHSIRDWSDANVPSALWARKCLDCNYQNTLHLPIFVKDHGATDSVFAFATDPRPPAPKHGGLGLF